jgi:uncharacterized membrane protein YccC
MDSTPSPKPIESDDVLVARADERLARTHEEIKRVDEQITRVQEQLAKLEHDAARQPADDPQPPRNEIRPPVPDDRPPRDRPVLRGLVGLLLAACIGVAAIAWQSSYGHAAKLIIAQWVPQLVPTSSLPTRRPAQPSPSTVQVTAAEPSSPQAAPQALTAPQDAAPVAAPASPELAQLLQTMARDLATVQQGIEQLKASQEQMARDNTKVAEQNLRLKTSAPPPRSVGAQTPVSSTPPASLRRHPRDDGPEKRTASRKPARVIEVDDGLFLEGEDGGWRPCPACSMR